MKRKAVAIFLCMALLAGMTAGCGSGGTEADSGQKEEMQDAGAVSEESNGFAGQESGGAEDGGRESSNLNAEGFPIVNEQITLTVYGQRDQNQTEWKNMLVMQEYEKMTNIHMDFQEVPADGFAENKQLLFASNELPDVFLRSAINQNEVSTYGVGSGQLMILDDLIEEYAPNLKKLFDENPSMRTACMAADGHIYTIPFINTSATGKMDFKQWINTKWLETLGVEIPTTVEEFKEVLIAFRDKDPNGNGEKDEIPLGIREPSSVYALGGAWGLGHQLGDTYDIDENGQIHNWLCDNKFKEYLIYLNDLYQEGLLWQEYYKNDRPAWRSNLSGELFGAMYMPYSDVFLNCEQDYSGYEPLIGPYGEKFWADGTTGVETGCYALSNTCSDPAAAIRWVDYFFSEEGGLFFAFGIEGITYTMDENGIPVFNDDILNAEEGFMTALGKINMVPGGGFPCLRVDETDGVVASQRTKDAAAILAPYLPEVYYAKPAVSAEETDRVVAIEQDLNTYRDEAVTKFIIGEWGFDKWDEYCQTLEQIGIRELEGIYQNAIDALK